MMLLSHRPLVGKNSKHAGLLAFICVIFLFLMLHGLGLPAYLRLVRERLQQEAAAREAPATDPSSAHLDAALAAPVSGIPKKLWYKLGPKGLSEDAKAWADGCIAANPEYEVHLLTDDLADRWVESSFRETHPEVVDLYLGLTVPILKADLLRYLLLFAEGGVYFDLDVSCERPIREWLPAEYASDASMVVGWEFDVGWGKSFQRQFATWTLMTHPGCPHIWFVVQDILDFLLAATREHGVAVGDLTLDMVGDVVDATGPRRFTRAVVRSAAELFGAKIDDFEELVEARLMGDVLVLPGHAFAASANRYGEAVVVPPPLVKHHYAGTWKNSIGGEIL